MSYTLEVIDANTYKRYQTLGIIDKEEPIIETEWPQQAAEEPDYAQMLDMLGMT